MAEKRADILARLKERLQGITRANGYLTDAGAAVYPWLKFRNSQGAEPIVLIYRDPRRESGSISREIAGLGEEGFALEIEIEAIVAADDDETTIAHNIITDLRRMLGVDPYFDDLVESIVWISDEIQTELGATITSFVSVSIQFQYVALAWAE